MVYKLITLRFLIPGNSKNQCDGLFGLVKQQLKTRDVYFPADMFDAMDNSSKTSFVVGPDPVQWKNWKTLLGDLFVVLATLRLNHCYIFSARHEDHGVLLAKKYTSTTVCSSFNVFKKDIKPDDIFRSISSRDMEYIKLPIQSLKNFQATEKNTRAVTWR